LLDGVEYRGLAVTKQTWLKKVYCGPERKLIETSQTPLLPFGASQSLRGVGELQLCIHALQYLDAMTQKRMSVAIKPGLGIIRFVHTLSLRRSIRSVKRSVKH
jgi:hypothetical protein